MLFQTMMQDSLPGFFISGMILFMFLMFAIGIFLTIFWILMIIDCAKRKMSDGERIAWILILVFLGFIGATVYYFAVKRR